MQHSPSEGTPMSSDTQTIVDLQARLDETTQRLHALEVEYEQLVACCQSVYGFLVEPNPRSGDPAPWDIVKDDHPVREAARHIVDTLAALGIEG